MFCKLTLLLALVIGLAACDQPNPQVKPDEPAANPLVAATSEPYILKRDEGEVLTDRLGRTTIIKVSPKTGSQHLAMGTQEMPPGTGILVHKHDRTEEILYVNEGSGTLILGEERLSVEANTTIWVPPGTWHGMENPDSHMHILWFVTPSGLDGFFRGRFWHPDEAPKQLSPDEISEIERQHDSVARPQ